MTNQEKIEQLIAHIKDLVERPNSTPLTPYQMAQRADRLRAYSTAVRLSGGKVRPEYE